MTWEAIYKPLIGQRLEGIAFMPMTGDTPTVAADLSRSHFWFSGAVCLRLNGKAPIYLTWHMTDLSLTVSTEAGWNALSLDSINMSPEAPWNNLQHAAFEGIQLYSRLCDLGRGPVEQIVAARHDFVGETPTSFWVCTGYASPGKVGDGDDLYVGLDVPKDLPELTPVRHIA